MILKNYLKNYIIPRIKYLYKLSTTNEDKFVLTFRLILLAFILLFFRKKNYIFSGRFGKEKFKLYLDITKKKHGSRGYYLLREKQEPILQFGHKLFKEGDVVIDGGANQGVFSLSFKSKIKEAGQIICVEPFNYAVKKIKKNFLLNNFKNFLIYKNVLSDKISYYKIYYSDGITDASIINRNSDNYKMVKSITIDHIVKKNKLKKLDFIKLDIEGAEYLALKGANKSILKFKPIIYLEINNLNNFKNINSFLNKINYYPYTFKSNGRLLKLKKYEKKNILYINKNYKYW